jgi:hypothetical protein
MDISAVESSLLDISTEVEISSGPLLTTLTTLMNVRCRKFVCFCIGNHVLQNPKLSGCSFFSLHEGWRILTPQKVNISMVFTQATIDPFSIKTYFYLFCFFCDDINALVKYSRLQRALNHLF